MLAEVVQRRSFVPFQVGKHGLAACQIYASLFPLQEYYFFSFCHLRGSGSFQR